MIPRNNGRSGGDDDSDGFSFMTESARVVLDTNGNVTVYTGSSPHGQGEETTFAQLASDELGVPFENTHVVWGDTQLIPFGVGTFGSRSAATGGSAVVDATRELKSRTPRNGVKGSWNRREISWDPKWGICESFKTKHFAIDLRANSPKAWNE